MTDRPDIPEEAVEALAFNMFVIAEVREALLGEAAVIAATKRLHPMLVQYETSPMQTALAVTRQSLEAALDAVLPTDSEGEL